MLSTKLSIDFDSAYTNIYKLGSGLVLSEPTVALVENGEKGDKGVVKAIGTEAGRLIGKTGKNSTIVFPVFEGEIVNESVASGLLSGFLRKVCVGATRVSAIFGLPCGANYQMIESYRRVAKDAGISKVYFAESPMLSALGQRIPFTDSKPCFIIDIAGGTTNIGAVSLDGVIAGVSVNFGGNKISADIIDYVAEKFGLQIGLLTADRLKKDIGSLVDGDALATIVNGRDVSSGSPKAMSIKAYEISQPIKKYFDKIAEVVTVVLKKLPPEVSAEIRHSGIYVAGAGACIYGLERYYADKFGIKVNVCENGLYAVSLGGGLALGDSELLKKITISCK